jgi:presenilin-like A22 family membrane protease
MIEMFKKLAQKGAAFSIIIPNRIKYLFTNLRKVEPGDEFLFLGTGDLAFPIVLSVSALKFGLLHSILAIAGAFLGMIGINVYQIVTKSKKPIAALPPIAGGAAFGFLVALLAEYLLSGKVF